MDCIVSYRSIEIFMKIPVTPSIIGYILKEFMSLDYRYRPGYDSVSSILLGSIQLRARCQGLRILLPALVYLDRLKSRLSHYINPWLTFQAVWSISDKAHTDYCDTKMSKWVSNTEMFILKVLDWSVKMTEDNLYLMMIKIMENQMELTTLYTFQNRKAIRGRVEKAQRAWKGQKEGKILEKGGSILAT